MSHKTGSDRTRYECQGCERQGPFTLDTSRSERVNYQRIRLQLPPEKSQGMGAEHIDLHVQSDLVNKVEVGDRATATVIPQTHEIENEKMPVLDWQRRSQLHRGRGCGPRRDRLLDGKGGDLRARGR
ncbi:MAG: hypothetical protein U5J98_07065 [Halobacteriales archaeon]|nr:hypothetical protein [Halobacteriales archaeon]